MDCIYVLLYRGQSTLSRIEKGTHLLFISEVHSNQYQYSTARVRAPTHSFSYLAIATQSPRLPKPRILWDRASST